MRNHRAAKGIGGKRAAAALVLSILAVPAIGGTASAASNSSGGKPVSSSAPKKHTSTPYERDLARAGVLKYDDLPSWVVTTEADGSDSLNSSPECPGEEAVRYVAGNSTIATKGAKSIYSSSMVVDSVKDAKAELRWLNSAAGLKCLRGNGSTDGSTDPGSDFSESESVSRIHVHLPGADDVVGFRTATTVTFAGTTMKTVGYMIDARVGRTEMSIWTSAGQLPSLRRTEQLLDEVVARVGEL